MPKITPLILILFGIIFLRIPSLFEPYWYGDEAIYLTLGEGVRQGLTLYKDIFDHKTPLIYAVAALAGSLFWFKFLLLASHLGSVFLYHKLAKVLFAKGALFATIIFALATTLPTLEGNIANAELFMSLPVIGGLLLVFSKERENFKTLFTAGLIFSLAVLYKVPAIFEVIALIAFWWISNLWNLKKYLILVKNTIFLSLGVLVPILGTGVYYTLAGALPQYLDAGLSINLNYILRWGTPAIAAADTAFVGGFAFRALVLASMLFATLIFKKFFDRTTLFTVIWFSFACFAMLLSGRPYPHYIIQAGAPLALLIAILVKGKQSQRFWMTPFILVFLIAVVFYKFYTYPTVSYYQNFLEFVAGTKKHQEYLSYFDPRIPRTYKIAKTIVSSTHPHDKIFIWGTEPELYALSRRLPPGRFVTSFHIVDFKGEIETLEALQFNPPKYILISLREPRDLPGLRAFLQPNYIYLETLEDIELWKKVDPELIRAVRK